MHFFCSLFVLTQKLYDFYYVFLLIYLFLISVDDTNYIFKTKALTTYDIAREFVELSRLKSVKEITPEA
jgi:hypothetical protein